MADEPVAVVEGPKGKAEIYEVVGSNKITEYQIKMGSQTESYKSLGEAYIEAGEMAGTKT